MIENVRVSTGKDSEKQSTINVNSLKKSISEIITKKLEFHLLLNQDQKCFFKNRMKYKLVLSRDTRYLRDKQGSVLMVA